MNQPTLIYKTIKRTVVDAERTGAAAARYRMSLGVSQAAIASRLGVFTQDLSARENGNRPWSEALLEKYCKAARDIKEGKQ